MALIHTASCQAVVALGRSASPRLGNASTSAAHATYCVIPLPLPATAGAEITVTEAGDFVPGAPVHSTRCPSAQVWNEGRTSWPVVFGFAPTNGNSTNRRSPRTARIAVE